MRKRIIALAALFAVALALLPGCKGAQQDTSPKGTKGDGYTTYELTLSSSDKSAPKTAAVRFYDELPSVPYIGLAQYMALVLGDEAKVDVTGGVASITSTDGGVAIVDDEANTLSSDSWATFHNYLKPMQEGKVAGFIDFGTPFCRISSLDYEKQAKPVTYDLARYDIDLHVDKDDAYLPLAVASSLMATVAIDSLAYNGRELCLIHGYYDTPQGANPDWYVPLVEDVPRAQDMVDFSYASLCFSIDMLYSCSGKGILDQDIAAKGLDAALSEKDDLTQRVRGLLKSTDKADYYAGLETLGYYLLNMHTSLIDTALLQSAEEKSEELSQRWQTRAKELSDALVQKEYLQTIQDVLAIMDEGPQKARSAAWGDDDSYHEQGDTAVITINSFMDYDYDGWDDFYAGKGDRPNGVETADLIGTLLSGLERAQANPAIKNVVIDDSTNGGGSNDLCATAVAILTGRTVAPAHDLLSNQRYTINYEIDTLFDGSFDSTAASKAYDFNFAVLTSCNSFSCGSYFPSLMRDAGVPIIGEASGGGTDMETFVTTPDGQCLTMTDAFAEMTDAEGKQFENGVPIYRSLVKTNEDGTKDYSDFYDLAVLSEVVNEYYAQEALPAAA